jgi:hypothetical protein
LDSWVRFQTAFLLGASQHRDDLGQWGVGWHRPVGGGVGAKDVGQRHGVGVV